MSRFPTRKEVDTANTNRLNRIKEELSYTYIAVDQPGFDDDRKPIPMEKAKKLLDNLVAPKEIVLKVC